MKILLLILLYLSYVNASGFFDKFYSHNNSMNDNTNRCLKKIDEIDTKKFNLFVKEVKKVGNDLVVYIQIRSKSNSFYIDFSRSSIVLVDKNGKSISLNSCKISNFHINSGEAQIFPLVFSEKRVHKLKSPYTLYLRLYKIGEITLTSLELNIESIEY